MTSTDFPLSDGRKLGVTLYGAPFAERLVVFCHPAPGSSEFDPDPPVSVDSDVHLVGTDRPGYGISTPRPTDQWPSVAGAADDIAEYLRSPHDTVHGESIAATNRVGVVGWGTGGLVALALAANHPGLVDRVAVVGTAAPVDRGHEEHDEWVTRNQSLATLPAAKAHESMVELLAERWGPGLPGENPDLPVRLDILGAAAVDDGVLELVGAPQRLDRMLRNAFRQGWSGWAADQLAAVAQPWGFEPAAVAAKTLLLYGSADPGASSKDARWFQEQIPDAAIEVVPSVGALVVISQWSRILAHVAPNRPIHPQTRA